MTAKEAGMKAALQDYKKTFELAWEHDIKKDNKERLKVNDMLDFTPADFTNEKEFAAKDWINKNSVLGPGARGLYRIKKTCYFKGTKVPQKVAMVCVGHGQSPVKKESVINKKGNLVKKRQRSSQQCGCNSARLQFEFETPNSTQCRITVLHLRHEGEPGHPDPRFVAPNLTSNDSQSMSKEERSKCIIHLKLLGKKATRKNAIETVQKTLDRRVMPMTVDNLLRSARGELAVEEEARLGELAEQVELFMNSEDISFKPGDTQTNWLMTQFARCVLERPGFKYIILLGGVTKLELIRY